MTAMNDNKYDCLLRMVEKYFDGDTTIEEEKWLRRELLSTDCRDAAVEEALAVMGYAATSRADALKSSAVAMRKSPSFPGWMAGAASVAVIIAISLALFSPQNAGKTGRCVAYIHGQKIEDAEVIRNLASLQIAEIGESSDDIDEQIQKEFHEFKIVMDNEQD